MAPEMGKMAVGWMLPSTMEAAEPKTLTLEQLDYARQAALYVLRTRTAEEAIRIFTNGLKPIRVCSSLTMTTDTSSDDDVVDLDSSEDNFFIVKRDVATAPL